MCDKAEQRPEKPWLPVLTICRYMKIYSHGRRLGKRLKASADVDNRLTEPENTIRETDSPPIKKNKSRS
jgi:hypothetical protein